MAKDAKGHGSEKRGTSMADDRRANPNDPVAKSFGIAAKFGANSSQLSDHLKEMARVQLNDMQAAKSIAEGNPKSDAPPVHPAMGRSEFASQPRSSVGPALRNAGAEGQRQARADIHAKLLAESLADFRSKYGPPRDHAAEQRGFNSGRREINRLKRQGK